MIRLPAIRPLGVLCLASLTGHDYRRHGAYLVCQTCGSRVKVAA